MKADWHFKLFLALATNALEVYAVPPPTKSKEELPEAIRLFSVDLPGHRTDVRTLSLSSDDMLLASASNGMTLLSLLQQLNSLHESGSLKIWNMKSTACIRTLDCGYAVCSTFLPGDRQVGLFLSL
jgi:U3 small nucleolar RNA-associated protein 12